MTHQDDTPNLQSGSKPASTPSSFRLRWIEKLKDPSTKKTCEYLHNDEGECCLGVAMTMNGATWAPGGTAVHNNIDCGHAYYDINSYEEGQSWANNSEELTLYGRQQVGITIQEHGAVVRLNDRCKDFRRVIAFLELCPDRTAPFDDLAPLTEAQQAYLERLDEAGDEYEEDEAEGDDDAGC